MLIFHRLDSKERKHYLLDEPQSFVVKTKMLYVGELNKNQEWRDDAHAHDFVEIIFVTDGKGRLLVDDNSYELKKGDVLIYNANVKHQEISSSSEPLQLFFVAYNELQLSNLEKNKIIPNHYSFMYESAEMFDTLKLYFQILIKEISNKEKFFSEIVQNASKTLLMYIFRLINNTADTSSLLASNPSFSSAMQYIELHYKENFSLEDISNMFYINKYYLAHLFKSQKQTSIKNYVLLKRLDEATTLLKFSKNSVSKISELLGFNNLNYFCRIFKKTYNETPLNYRNKK